MYPTLARGTTRHTLGSELMYNFGSGNYTTYFGVGVNVQLWVGELHDPLWDRSVCTPLGRGTTRRTWGRSECTTLGRGNARHTLGSEWMYNFGSGNYTTHLGSEWMYTFGSGHYTTHFGVCIYLSTTPHKHIVVISVFFNFVEYIAIIRSSYMSVICKQTFTKPFTNHIAFSQPYMIYSVGMTIYISPIISKDHLWSWYIANNHSEGAWLTNRSLIDVVCSFTQMVLGLQTPLKLIYCSHSPRWCLVYKHLWYWYTVLIHPYGARFMHILHSVWITITIITIKQLFCKGWHKMKWNKLMIKLNSYVAV